MHSASSDRAAALRLLRLARPHIGRLVLAAVCMVVSTLSFLAIPYAFRLVTDSVFVHHDAAQLNQVTLLLLAVVLLTAGFGFGRGYLLQYVSGRILVLGSYPCSSPFNHACLGVVSELYDPFANTWSRAGAMVTLRVLPFQSVVLKDGRVLVAGGPTWAASVNPLPNLPLAQSEVYDPKSGTWHAVASMHEAREGQALALLPDGRVLSAGGFGQPTLVGSSDMYNSMTNRWTMGTVMPVPLWKASTVRLPGARILVVGGYAAVSPPRFARALEECTPPQERVSIVSRLMMGSRVQQTLNDSSP